MTGAPGFWRNPPERPGALAWALLPFARLAKVRQPALPELPLGVPLISLGQAAAFPGDLVTPAAVAVLHRLQARGAAPEVLTLACRAPPPLLGDIAPLRATAHGARGPLLLPGVLTAGAGGGGARLAILLVAATTGFGNGLPLPAGPLRAPLEPMLAQSGLLILSGTALARRAFLRRWQGTALPPVQEATLGPLATGMAWSGLRAIVIARGDARPIAAALTGEGAEVLRAVALDQRGRVSAALCARLVAEARRERAQLVAGEAEAAALPPGFRSQVLTLPMRLTAADWSPLDAALRLIGAIP